MSDTWHRRPSYGLILWSYVLLTERFADLVARWFVVAAWLALILVAAA
jgi:hypothetical protein